MVNNVPNSAPERVITSIEIGDTSACALSIHIPGRVNARPPATIAPELIMVWVTLISCNEEPLNRRRTAILTTVTKTVGQGRAPMRKETYMELLVMTIRPSRPMMNPRRVN